jgi:hypothetical protein
LASQHFDPFRVGGCIKASDAAPIYHFAKEEMESFLLSYLPLSESVFRVGPVLACPKSIQASLNSLFTRIVALPMGIIVFPDDAAIN